METQKSLTPKWTICCLFISALQVSIALHTMVQLILLARYLANVGSFASAEFTLKDFAQESVCPCGVYGPFMEVFDTKEYILLI